MQRAIDLARPFHPHPNPRVGCVIVNDEEVVGEGAHQQAGTDHAEVLALRAAGENALGSTAYVTLEPCAHTGRTPPCTEALIDRGVAKVVAAVGDPDRLVAGRGVASLESAGVDVQVGLLEQQAVALDRGYHHHRATGRPWVQAVLSHAGIGEEAIADIDDLIASLDLVVTAAGEGLDPADAAPLEEQLIRLGSRDVIDVGVGDDQGLLEALASGGWIDGVTIYSASAIPDWGPLSGGLPFTVREVRSIGSDVRIEALSEAQRTA